MAIEMRTTGKTVIAALAAATMLCGCARTPRFEVSGCITNAEGETLYLEHTGLVRTAVEDSCVLPADGAYTLRGKAPEYPDFYRLRIGKDYAVLVVDSTETIRLCTTRDSLVLTQAFAGSEASVTVAELRQSLREKPIDEHRQMAQGVILKQPRSMAAYYAVFQSKQGVPVFDMYDPSQRRYYQAVATSMNLTMPDYVRTRTLYTQVIDALNAERKALNEMAMRQYIDESESTMLDIALPNIYGDTCWLSEHLGKVVLLEFSTSQMERGNAYVLALRDLDNKYNVRGLDIYSVSVDPVKLYWEDWVRNLPWTCVRTETTTPLLTYNVTTLPTMFLLDRKGQVQGRYDDFEQLEKAIKRELKISK